MARYDINRFWEMSVFIKVVEGGTFSAAAITCNMTPSAVSKLISRLEKRLEARLLTRSTRRLQLTAEGCSFYERSSRILSDLDDAERQANAGEHPAGRIRISTSASYATHVLIPIIGSFAERYPDITLDIIQTDVVVDLLAERTDVAIRAGQMTDSRLTARKLGETARVIVASPEYLAKNGTPQSADDLHRHRIIGPTYIRTIEGWPLRGERDVFPMPVKDHIQASDGEAIRQLALAGAGLARLTAFTVQSDIAHKRLVPVLEHLNPGDREEFHAVYVGQGGPVPARVKALLDFLRENGKVH
ncbi:LysR family transcriptional regulator [Labrenzia sp. CE80]|uniref:LysR family transcriptional regulator n=1 Tax=Labrenzia sp. CE80 TaxID=1788986 RepID=UPI00129BC149|nr:LysR family transcriptional regulator [Labrenzia sp. CE80]